MASLGCMTPRSIGSGILFMVCFAVVGLHGQLSVDESLATIGPEPDWIVPVDYPSNIDNASRYEEGGRAYLLVESQERPAEAANYWRQAFRFLTVTGVEDHSTLSWQLDPDFERLILHKLVLRRNGNEIDLLPRVQFRFSSANQSDEAQSYDNAIVARILLEDARVGDLVEYSYTFQGENPITKGRYNRRFILDWSAPVGQAFHRILWESDRQLNWKVYRGAVEPEIAQGEGFTLYRWSVSNVPPNRWEPELPPQYYLSRWVQLSDWSSWEEVSQWGRELYPLEAPLPETLQPVVERLQALPSLEARVVAAVRYVQDEYRYVSVVFGPHGYQPFSPEAIARRRYGDCKDKALLLCLLLRELGVTAEPVLVDIDDRGSIQEMLPSPGAFDHVVTRFQVDGEWYWADATINLQGGGLGDFYFPNYEAGLPLREGGSTLLTDIQSGGGPGRTELKESFRFSRWDGGATLDVTTTYYGEDADSMRRRLASQSLKDLSADYLDYYVGFLGATTVREPIAVEDDREANRLTVTEAYTVNDLFVPERDGQPNEEFRYFEADFMRDQIPEAAEGAERIHPLWVAATDLAHKIELHLPDDSYFPDEKEVVLNEWFHFSHEVTLRNRVLTLHNHYRADEGTVPAKAYARFAADLAQLEPYFSYGITADTSTPGHPPQNARGAWHPNWLLIAFSGLVLFAASGFSWWLWHRHRSADFPARVPEGPTGIGGWLILPAIGICVSPLTFAFAVFESGYLYNLNEWMPLTDPASSNYLATFELLVIFEFAFNLSFFVLSLLLLISFFTRRWYVRRFYQFYLGIQAVLLSVDAFWAIGLTDTGAEASVLAEGFAAPLRAWVTFFLWASYFQVSKRVRNTFRR